MKFIKLANYLEKLEKTSSRNEMTEILSKVFKETSRKEIDKTVNLILGQLAPSYEAVVFNVAERMMVQILAKAYSVEVDKARKMYKEKGDLGVAAEKLAKGKGKGLSVEKVYDRLLAVAEEEGEGSQERKITKMADLLSGLDPLSARYVARIPVGKLRLGFSDMTILDALSYMLKGDKSARDELEHAFNVTANIGRIAKRAKEQGLKDIDKVTAEAGTPIRPSLAERLPSAEKIIEKVGEKVAIEPKYDGFRTQVHVFKEGKEKKVKVFSRNLDNTTHMFPELVDAVKKLKVDSAIFDGEAIAYLEKEDKFLPFQKTVQRKRKHGIEEAAKKYPLVLFLFDILYKNGKTLLNKKFEERRKILEKTVKKHDNGTVRVTNQDVVEDSDAIRDLITKYLDEGLEGGMIKKLDAVYKAGGRGYHWVKYKKTTEQELADTIDCVVLGTYRGRGKRAEFGVGAFLVGVKDGEEFKSISKIGTGLTDAQFKELDKRTKKLRVDKKPKEYDVDKKLQPDFWAKPELVVEIMADEITKSPIHTAGKTKKRGYALRFPRLVKFRDDKDSRDATTVKEVEKLYKLQKR